MRFSPLTKRMIRHAMQETAEENFNIITLYRLVVLHKLINAVECAVGFIGNAAHMNRREPS